MANKESCLIMPSGVASWSSTSQSRKRIPLREQIETLLAVRCRKVLVQDPPTMCQCVQPVKQLRRQLHGLERSAGAADPQTLSVDVRLARKPHSSSGGGLGNTTELLVWSESGCTASPWQPMTHKNHQHCAVRWQGAMTRDEPVDASWFVWEMAFFLTLFL